MATSSSHKYTNIARPYALAAFEYARDSKQLPAWKIFLATAADVVQQPQIARLLPNPEITAAKWFELFSEVLASQVDVGRKNFLHLLALRKRLMVLPEIATLFDEYYAELEKMSTVKVITAIDITDEYRQKLIASFSKRLHHDITLESEVDPSIIGGAIFHLGDKVIDGSIRGKLNRLLESTLG